MVSSLLADIPLSSSLIEEMRNAPSRWPAGNAC